LVLAQEVHILRINSLTENTEASKEIQQTAEMFEDVTPLTSLKFCLYLYVARQKNDTPI